MTSGWQEVMCFLGSVLKPSLTLVESLHFSGIENMATSQPSKAGYGSTIPYLRLEWDVHGGYVALDTDMYDMSIV